MNVCGGAEPVGGASGWETAAAGSWERNTVLEGDRCFVLRIVWDKNQRRKLQGES